MNKGLQRLIFRKRVEVLGKEIDRLYRRAKYGMLTESEKRRKGNELASEYLSLCSDAERLLKPYPLAKRYLQYTFLEVAARLKLLAAESAEPTRKSPRIQRKVISPYNHRRY